MFWTPKLLNNLIPNHEHQIPQFQIIACRRLGVIGVFLIGCRRP